MLSTQKGQQTEQACCDYLSRAGLKLIEKNYRCKLGEVDLVMQERSTLVFIEVRYRSNACYGGGLYSIDHRKQRKLINTAQHYLQYHRVDSPVRIDVVAMSPDGHGHYEFEWIRDAVSTD